MRITETLKKRIDVLEEEAVFARRAIRAYRHYREEGKGPRLRKGRDDKGKLTAQLSIELPKHLKQWVITTFECRNSRDYARTLRSIFDWYAALWEKAIKNAPQRPPIQADPLPDEAVFEG